jgi:hypothetical protein
MSPQTLGLVSDQRAANGGVMASVKKAKTDNTVYQEKSLGYLDSVKCY